MEEAEKALQEGDRLMGSSRSSFLGFIPMGSGPDYHEAADKYSLAGNLYKAAGDWPSAGSAYMKAATACDKDNAPEEAARKRVTAATCFKKAPGQAERALQLYAEANDVYIRAGRFAMVGNNERECGEICLELQDKQRAADYFKKAAERYMAENSPASAAGCKQKEASLSAESGQYLRAVNIFEGLAKSDSADSTRKFNCKENLFKAGLVRLAMGDVIGARKQIEVYLSIDSGFGSSREYKLLEALLNAIDEQDSDAFTEAVSEYERINRLDDWKVNLLYQAKQAFEAEPTLA